MGPMAANDMAAQRDLVMHPDEVRSLILQLSITDAPLVRDGVRKTIQFFRTEIGIDPLDAQWLTVQRGLEYLKGIDFHSPVSSELVRPPLNLVQYRPDDPRPKPFMYLGEVGQSNQTLGINWPGYRFMRYELVGPARALVSRAADIAWGGRIRPGGGRQYILRTFGAPLRLTHQGPSR